MFENLEQKCVKEDNMSSKTNTQMHKHTLIVNFTWFMFPTAGTLIGKTFRHLLSCQTTPSEVECQV